MVCDPLRSGPATAIVVDDTSYLVDLGPGIVRRAAAAAEKGIASRYPDLIFTTWVQGRRAPLKVYGPAGLADMTIWTCIE